MWGATRPNARKQFFMGVNADKDALFPQHDSQTDWPPQSAMPHGMAKSSMEMRFDEVVGGVDDPVRAAGASAAGDPALAKAVLMKSIAFRTVEGEGQVPRLAAYYASVLREAGFAAADVEIMPVGETATLAATIRGSDPQLKPLLMIGHMDVVAANRADWTRDPFLPVEENGYIFGRGRRTINMMSP